MLPEVASPARSPTSAYVIFVRPSLMGGAVQYTVIDAKLRFLGEAVYRSRWTVKLEPGEHWFYALGNNVSVLHAELLAGHTYYVVVRPRMGPRVQLTALTRRTVDWQKLDEWLAGTEALVADLEAGQAKLDEDPTLIRSQAAEAAEVWRGMTPADRELHTLHSGDGVPF